MAPTNDTWTRYKIYIGDDPAHKAGYIIADRDEADREFEYALDYARPGVSVELVEMECKIIRTEESN